MAEDVYFTKYKPRITALRKGSLLLVTATMINVCPEIACKKAKLIRKGHIRATIEMKQGKLKGKQITILYHYLLPYSKENKEKEVKQIWANRICGQVGNALQKAWGEMSNQ